MEFNLEAFEILFLLIAGHAVADFGLQTEFIARFKSNREQLHVGDTKMPQLVFLHLLFSHSLMHGLAVFLILQNLWLALAETVVHAIIDHMKCNNHYGFHMDQFLHIGCKLVWWGIWLVALR